MILFALPFVILQILGLLFSLVILASYFKGLVLLQIGFIILANFIVLKFILFKGDPFTDVKSLYDKVYGIYVQERRSHESKSIFWTAILTSWISPCTVWANNLTLKSYFLLTSSLTTIAAQVICILCTYVFILFDQLDINSNPPITHCFQNLSHSHNLTEENNIFKLMKICNENCRPIQRQCSENEIPTDLLFEVVGPIGLGLLCLSFVASVCLQVLGNYRVMHDWSKKMFCGHPITHFSFLNDALRKNLEKKDMKEIMDIIRDSKESIKLKDPLYGQTLVDALIDNDADKFDYLNEMVRLNANFYIQNREGDCAFATLRKFPFKDEEDRLKVQQLYQAIIRNKLENKLCSNEKRVWKRQPLYKALDENNLLLFCFYILLGGHNLVSNVFFYLSLKLDNNSEAFLKQNRFVKSFLSMIGCLNGLTLIHLAAEDGNAELLKTLLNVSTDGNTDCLLKLLGISTDVNVRRVDNGNTPLHYAAHFGHEDCVRLLIEKGADVNSQNLNHTTPLHNACCTLITGKITNI